MYLLIKTDPIIFWDVELISFTQTLPQKPVTSGCEYTIIVWKDQGFQHRWQAYHLSTSIRTVRCP